MKKFTHLMGTKLERISMFGLTILIFLITNVISTPAIRTWTINSKENTLCIDEDKVAEVQRIGMDDESAQPVLWVRMVGGARGYFTCTHAGGREYVVDHGNQWTKIPITLKSDTAHPQLSLLRLDDETTLYKFLISPDLQESFQLQYKQAAIASLLKYYDKLQSYPTFKLKLDKVGAYYKGAQFRIVNTNQIIELALGEETKFLFRKKPDVISIMFLGFV